MIEDFRLRLTTEGTNAAGAELGQLDRRIGALGGSLGDLERQADAAADAAEDMNRRLMPPRDAQGRWVRTSQALKEVRKEIGQLNADAAMDKFKRSTKEYVLAARRAATESRKLERASMTLGERFTESLETFENLEGVLGLVEMAVGAAVAAFEAAKIGGQLQDISASASAAGINVERLAGSLTGLGKVQTAALVRAAQASNSGALLTSLTGDIQGAQAFSGGTRRDISLSSAISSAAVRSGAEATDLLAGVQGDIASRQAGAGFAAIGADIDHTNLQLQRFRDEAMKTAQLIEGNAFVDPVADTFALISAGTEDAMLASRQFKDATSEALAEAGSIWMDFQADLGGFTSGFFVDAEAAEEVRQSARQVSAVAVKEISNYMRSGAADITPAAFEEMNEVLAEAIKREKEAQKIRDDRGDAAKYILEAKNLQQAITAEMADQLAASAGLGENAAKGFLAIQSSFDLEQLQTRLKDVQLLRERDRLKLNVDINKAKAAQAKTLGNDILAGEHEAAAAEFERLHAASMMATEYEQIAQIKLAADAAIVADRFRATAGAVAEMRQDLAASTGLTATLMGLGRGLGDTITSAVYDAFGTADAKPKETRRRTSSKKKDDPSDLLFEASLIGLDEFEQRQRRAERAYEQSAETFKANAEAIGAAQAILIDKVATLNEELARRNAEAMKAAGQAAGEIAARFVADIARAQDELADVRFSESISGLGPGEQALAQRARAAEAAFDAEKERIESLMLLESQRQQMMLANARRFAEEMASIDREQFTARLDAVTAFREQSTDMFFQQRRETTSFAQAAGDELIETERAAIERRLEQRGYEADQIEVQLSRTTQATLYAADGVMAAGESVGNFLANWRAQQEALAEGTTNEIAAGTSYVGQLISGAAAIAEATGAGVREVAGIKGAFQVAEAAAAVAEAFTNPAAIGKAIAHGAAAAKYFAIAGGGTSAKVSGQRLKEQQREQRRERQRTALSRDAGLARDRRGNQPIINVIVSPLTGRAMAGELNRAGFADTGVVIDPSLVQPLGRRDL